MAMPELLNISRALVRARAALGVDGVAPLPDAAGPGEVAAFASSVGCAYHLSDGEANPAQLLDALTLELEALRFALAMRRKVLKAQAASAGSTSLESELLSLCRALSIPPPRGDVASAHPEKVLAQTKAKVEPFVSRLPPAFFEQRSLLPATLATPSILSALEEINSILRDDYTTRRGMLLQRLDVTVESFLWSAKAMGKESEILGAIAYRRRGLSAAPGAIRAEDAFAAGPELAALHSRRVTDVCSAGARSSSVKNVRIGDVPDRGGRVGELNLTKGAADMPLWAARKQARKTEKAAAALAFASGGVGEGISSQNKKDERARALLTEASKFEGEAVAALAEHEEDMAVEAAEQALNTRKQTWSARGGSREKR